MASEEQKSNGTNDRNSCSSREKDASDETVSEMTGWLMKRSKLSHQWKRKWFHLKKTELCYSDSPEATKLKKIPLESAEIAETSVDQKLNTFRLKPKGSKRTFYLQAEDEGSQHDWMQAICFAKVSGGSDHDSQACTLQ
ncbi:hypothetical protein CAPTEDRAFT_199525 [Capitella teleta]|uniref:PH domain-containing protein n=1 Tax=Capitella teleta TaxID=283909 RepID=R7UWG1_CAPTE|nr:hypothetical protein CAPTEDRAFT_199525 [Capitella teleta]|eukprot:ELU07716.1 hypothetical protein CAPTEDRAFT_199525 [Capitella teleta]